MARHKIVSLFIPSSNGGIGAGIVGNAAGIGVSAVAANIHRLRPVDWKSGTTAVLMDVMAPFGHSDGIIAHRASDVLKDTPLKAVMTDPVGQTRILDLFRGQGGRHGGKG